MTTESVENNVCTPTHATSSTPLVLADIKSTGRELTLPTIQQLLPVEPWTLTSWHRAAAQQPTRANPGGKTDATYVQISVSSAPNTSKYTVNVGILLYTHRGLSSSIMLITTCWSYVLSLLYYVCTEANHWLISLRTLRSCVRHCFWIFGDFNNLRTSLHFTNRHMVEF